MFSFLFVCEFLAFLPLAPLREKVLWHLLRWISTMVLNLVLFIFFSIGPLEKKNRKRDKWKWNTALLLTIVFMTFSFFLWKQIKGRTMTFPSLLITSIGAQSRLFRVLPITPRCISLGDILDTLFVGYLVSGSSPTKRVNELM